MTSRPCSTFLVVSVLLASALTPLPLIAQRCYISTVQSVHGGTLDLDLYIQNTSTRFVLGTSSFVVQYSKGVLDSPMLVPANDGPWSSSDPDYAALSSLDHPDSGYVDMVVLFNGGGDNTGATVTATPVRIGTLRFTLTDTVAAAHNMWRALASVTQVTALANPGVDLSYRDVTDSCAFHLLDLRAILQGPYASGAMQTSLRARGVIPAVQPYTAAPWSYAGTESFSVIPEDVVDWVLIELRSGTGAATKAASQAAFLHSNGTITTADSVPFIGFKGIESGSYYVVVRHRNHLAVMSAVPVPLGVLQGTYDLTTGLSKYYGGDAREVAAGVFGLYAGDADGDGQVTSTDFNVFNPKFTAAATGYQRADWNCDGLVTSTDFNVFNANFTAARRTRVP